eukprot:TRINITY_DN6940_c0_g1_i11.p2 TRINITY_DN6940_c0_g1~~TRINITY_DN6940_c0_g1_i11.p2  ORF type:complete len:150 (-),score=33.93 TRINITY_DN6940_c0_g1_i11:730-1179(-)
MLVRIRRLRREETVAEMRWEHYFSWIFSGKKTEKERRIKKDEIIRQMALEQKQRKEQGKSQSTTYPSMGGFVGINKLTDPSRTPVTTTRRRREQENEEPSAPVQGDNQMFILGLLKEQTQEIKDKEKVEVNESSLLCASDESQIAKFCH